MALLGVCAAFCLSVALIGLTLGYLETPSGHTQILRIGLPQARRFLPNVTVGEISGNYFTSVVLRDVEWKDGDDLVARVPRIEIHYRPWSLFSLYLHVTSVVVEEPDVRLALREDGELNLLHALVLPPPSPDTSDDTPTRFAITVDSVEVHNAAFRFGEQIASASDIWVNGTFHWDAFGSYLNGRVQTVVERPLQKPVTLIATAAGSVEHFPFEVSIDAGDDGHVALSGELQTLPFAYEVYGNVEKLSLDLIDPSLADSRATLRFAAQGEALPFVFDGRALAVVSIEPSRIIGIPIEAAMVSANAHEDKWEVARAEVATCGASIVAKGHGEGKQLSADARIGLNGGTRLPGPLKALRGTGAIFAHAEGELPGALNVTANGALSEVKFASVSAERIVIDAAATGVPAAPVGQAHVVVNGFSEAKQGKLLQSVDAKVTASAKSLDAVVTATADPSRGGPSQPVDVALHLPLATEGGVPSVAERGDISGKVSWKNFPLTLVNAFTDAKVFDKGSGDLTATLSGQLHAPVVDAHLTLSDVAIADFADIDAQLDAHSETRTSRVTLAVQQKKKPALDFHAQMRAGLRQLAAPKTLVNVPMTAGVSVHEVGMGKFVETLHGKVTLAAELNGTVGAPQGHLDATWKNAQVGTYHFGDITAGVLLASRENQTHVTVSSEVDGERLFDAMAIGDGQSGVWLEEKRIPTFTFNGLIGDFDLATLAAGDFNFARTAGKLRAEFSGRFADQALHASGSLHLVDGTLAGEPIGALAVSGAYEPGLAHAHLTLTQPKGGALDGSADWQDATLTASLRAQKIDLAFLRPALPDIRALGGEIQAHLQAKGKLDALALSGDLYLEKGSFGITPLPTFKDIAVGVVLRSDGADVAIKEMKSGKGNLTGTAKIGFEKLTLKSVVADLKTKEFSLGLADATFESTIHSDILFADNITGDIKVSDALLKIPKLDPGHQPRGTSRPKDVVYIDEPKERAKLRGEANGTPVDLNIEVTQLFVRGDQVDAEIGSHLEMKVNRAGQFLPRGSVSVHSGYLMLFNRRWDFTEGEVGLNGNKDINPSLKISLQHAFTDVTATVGLQGTLSAPELVLRSDPAIYDRAQIVSLVVNGQVSSGDTKSPDAKTTVTNAVVGAALGALASTLAPKIGLDVFKVDVGAPQSNTANPAAIAAANATDPNATVARVEVGKYIAKKLYVSYDRIFGAPQGQNSNEAHVEYRMTPKLTLQSLFGDAGVGALDLLWTYRY